MNKERKIPNLRKIRLSKGMSGDELSFESGVPVRRIYRMERGLERFLREKDMAIIAEILGVSIEEAFYSDNTSK